MQCAAGAWHNQDGCPGVKCCDPGQVPCAARSGMGQPVAIPFLCQRTGAPGRLVHISLTPLGPRPAWRVNATRVCGRMDTFHQRPEGSPQRSAGVPLADRAARTLGSARDRIGVAVLAVERARRGTLARMRRSRLLRWQHRSPIARDLLLAPPDLRPQDPCFAEEVESGSFGLCGQTVDLNAASPFAVRPPSQAWAQELHAFGWLRHFSAGWTVANEATARRLVAQWIAGRRRHAAEAWAPEVVGRRIVAWLSHASLILDGAERRPYRAILLSLEDQVTH